MEWLPALLTLTVLEIVLGIDNIVFISILTGRLPLEKQRKARNIGLTLAMVTRILLLLSLTWVMSLKADFFTLMGNGISGRDMILIVGGLFLLWKSTSEIHSNIEGGEHDPEVKNSVSYTGTLLQIMFLDIVFSLDSVITAIGMANQIWVMVTAVVLAVVVMLFSSHWISEFIERHPTIKVLALSFLLMIGVALIADGLDLHIPKGYIYFSMAFSVMIEGINIRIRSKRRPSNKLQPEEIS